MLVFAGFTVAGLAIRLSDLGAPVEWGTAHVALVFREMVSRYTSWIIHPFGVLSSTPKRTSAAKILRVPPTLLIPSMHYNRSSLFFLSIFLKNQGVAWVWPVNRAPTKGSLAQQAETLCSQIDLLCSTANTNKVDLVGFGTGGLVAAWYIKHYGAEKVRRLVTIATPWRGTKMAVFLRHEQAREIQFGSHVLDGLFPEKIPTTSIIADLDPTIAPASSAVPKGAQVVTLPAAGHLDLLFSARAYRAVLASLTAPIEASSLSDDASWPPLDHNHQTNTIPGLLPSGSSSVRLNPPAEE